MNQSDRLPTRRGFLGRLLGGLAVLAGLRPRVSQADEPAGYALHEWGVFTVPRGARWAHRDMLDEWADMPAFFHGRLPARVQAYRGPVRKPVIFVHATKSQAITLEIRFAEGRPLIWWPPAEKPALGMPEGDPRDLAFSLSLVGPEHGQGERIEELPTVPDGHWVARLRRASTTTLYATGSHTRLGTSLHAERFVYYDGLMRAPASPVATRTADGVELRGECDHAWHDAIAIERRGDVLTASPWVDHVAAGPRALSLALTPTTPAALAKDLNHRLVAAELSADEAASLVDIWTAALFAAEGLRVVYRVPRATYDAWLPLTATPAPRAIVRVGLVLHERLEPELPARLAALIERLGAPEFDDREAASRELAAIGGAAYEALALAGASPDPEIASRSRALVRATDALEVAKLPE